MFVMPDCPRRSLSCRETSRHASKQTDAPRQQGSPATVSCHSSKARLLRAMGKGRERGKEGKEGRGGKEGKKGKGKDGKEGPRDLVHLGPFEIEAGTLTAVERDLIWSQYGVSAAVRSRSQWGTRCLTLTGPSDQVAAAKVLAEHFLEDSRGDAPGAQGLQRSQGSTARGSTASGSYLEYQPQPSQQGQGLNDTVRWLVDQVTQMQWSQYGSAAAAARAESAAKTAESAASRAELAAHALSATAAAKAGNRSNNRSPSSSPASPASSPSASPAAKERAVSRSSSSNSAAENEEPKEECSPTSPAVEEKQVEQQAAAKLEEEPEKTEEEKKTKEPQQQATQEGAAAKEEEAAAPGPAGSEAPCEPAAPVAAAPAAAEEAEAGSGAAVELRSPSQTPGLSAKAASPAWPREGSPKPQTPGLKPKAALPTPPTTPFTPSKRPLSPNK